MSLEPSQNRILAIVVNYNQSLEISSFLNQLQSRWPQEDVVIVDDGSVDASDQMAEKKGYKVIRHGKNKGVGAAIRSGIDFAKKNNYESVLISSSNGKMKPEDFSKLTQPLRNNEADYVLGNRYLKGGGSPGLSLFRRIAIPIFSLISTLVLGRYYSDITCGLRAYKLSILEDSRINIHQEWLNKYELEYYIQYWATRMNIRILEVPVTMQYSHLEKHRRSKIKAWSGWWSMLRPFLLLGSGFKK